MILDRESKAHQAMYSGKEVTMTSHRTMSPFYAKGGAELEDSSRLETGDAGARRLTADSQTGAEVLVWETASEMTL